MTTVNRKELVKALAGVKKAVPRRTLLPILGSVRLKYGNGMLELEGTDLEVLVRTEIPATGEGEWAVCVPPRLLADALKSKDASVELTPAGDGKSLSVKAGGIIRIACEHSPQDWPHIEPHTETSFDIQGLPTMLKRVAHAMQQDDNRLVLHGTHVSIKDGVAEFVAADGFRLAVVRGSVGKNVEGDVILPFALSGILCSVFNDDAVIVGLGAQWASFHQGRTTILAKLVQGHSPNYQQLIPGDPPHRIRVNRAELIQTVQGANRIAKDGNGAVRFEAKAGEEKLRVWAIANEIGEFEAELPCKGRIKVAMNGKYVLQILDSLLNEEVAIETTNTSDPVKIVEGEYTEVIMSLFMKWEE